jgi:CDP-glycerol glycerophosphotransferase (TagB/SpsB family)
VRAIFKYVRARTELAHVLGTQRKVLLLDPKGGLLSGNALGLALAAQLSDDFLPVFVGKRRAPLEIPTWNKESCLAPLLWKRADVIAYTGYPSLDMAKSRTFRLLLWHGMPIKGIGTFDSFPASIREPCDLAIATSERTAQIMSESFGIAPEKITISGEPKTDYLPTDRRGWDWSSSLRRQYPTIIGYLPTWREKIVEKHGQPQRRRDDEAQMHFARQLTCDAALRNLLDRHRAAFVIRVHPKHSKSVPLSPPFFLMDDTGGDATHLLQECDVIIGDYSSVVIDALLFDRPLALWCEDLETYTRLRPLPYFNFRNTFGWALKMTLPELRYWIAQRLESHPLTPVEVDGFARCRAIFHRHSRGGAGDRVLEAVRARLKSRFSA